MIDVGAVIGNKYRLVRLVGEGGMGAVYEAEHMGLGNRVAVKVLHPELARRGGLVERFLQEARVAAQIRSPHVVRVSDVDRTPEGQAYIVMDLLVGEPLSAVLQRQRRLPIATACEYTVQILDALEAAHSLGIIHRDLKPENVLVTTEGGKPVLKLIDFGIAKARRGETEKTLTVAGALMGTAEYMAPEQARSAGAVDGRADVYAVGVMLYEMIAGARPVTGDDARAVALKVERGEVAALLHVAPETPREIAGIVHHAMAPRPEMRFGTAAEMRAALEEARAGRAVASRVPTAPPSERPMPTQRALPIAPALGPAFAASVGTVAAPPLAAEAPRRGRPVLWALLVLGVLGLVGAGGVLAVQAGLVGSPAPAPTPEQAAPAVAASTSPVATTPAAPATSAAGGTSVPALQPTRPSGAPGPPGKPAGDAGRALPAFGNTPSLFPSDLPFPTTLPSTLPPGFPTTLPTSLPSGFPTSLPSGFPIVLPPWPAAPQATPAPAASASGPTI